MKDRTGNSIGTIEWSNIDWKVINKAVQKIRFRIFKAANNARSGIGSWNKVRSLMKLLHRSFFALLHSIRRVTYLNKGKDTPGVDGLTIANRNTLIKEWNWSQVKFLPTRRVYIPKSNGKKRPLGIPAIMDRIAQAVLLLSYEAVFEGSFESNSYGFRPGRSCHDAIFDIFLGTSRNSVNKWVLEADIKGAFDNISHEYLLKRIQGLPGSEMIRKWLQSGYMESSQFHATETGTPQGGIISPLLANIALDGLQTLLEPHKGESYYYSFQKDRCKSVRQRRKIPKYKFVRYADDFVVLSPKEEWLWEAKEIISNWLEERGLTLNENKTKITKIEDGFEFLGFLIRQHRGEYLRTMSREFYRRLNKPNEKGKNIAPPSIPKDATYTKVIIKPSKNKIKNLLDDIRDLVKSRGLAIPFGTLITMINSKVRGWCNYYRKVCSKETFNYIKFQLNGIIFRLLRRLHPNKKIWWLRKKYFTKYGGNNWKCFGTVQTRKGTRTVYLLNPADIVIVRHIKVKDTNSTLDPQLKDYWIKRNKDNAKSRFANGSKYQNIINAQKGLCPVCGEPISENDEWELHHKIPVKDGGTEKISNLIFLHKECHKAKHKELHW